MTTTSVAPGLHSTEVPRAGGWRRALRATLGRSYPRIIGANRDRSWLFYDTVLPLLGTIAFVYVYKALGAPEQFRNAISQAATAGPHLDFDTVKPQGSETKREWGSLSAQIQRGP